MTNTESPIVVVLRFVACHNSKAIRHWALTLTLTWTRMKYSGSMEPAFYRGDLLFLTNPANTPYQVGDITVYNIPGKPIPIVHRVLETHTKSVTSGRTLCPHNADIICARRSSNPVDQLILTKGDNNPTDDIGLYEGLKWIERKHVVGKVAGSVFTYPPPISFSSRL